MTRDNVPRQAAAAGRIAPEQHAMPGAGRLRMPTCAPPGFEVLVALACAPCSPSICGPPHKPVKRRARPGGAAAKHLKGLQREVAAFVAFVAARLGDYRHSQGYQPVVE